MNCQFIILSLNIIYVYKGFDGGKGKPFTLRLFKGSFNNYIFFFEIYIILLTFLRKRNSNIRIRLDQINMFYWINSIINNIVKKRELINTL